jgi:hypothetical protein
MNARKIILVTGVGLVLGCGRFDKSPPGNPPPPPPPPTGNPPMDTGMKVPESPEVKKSAVDHALEAKPDTGEPAGNPPAPEPPQPPQEVEVP